MTTYAISSGPPMTLKNVIASTSFSDGQCGTGRWAQDVTVRVERSAVTVEGTEELGRLPDDRLQSDHEPVALGERRGATTAPRCPRRSGGPRYRRGRCPTPSARTSRRPPTPSVLLLYLARCTTRRPRRHRRGPRSVPSARNSPVARRRRFAPTRTRSDGGTRRVLVASEADGRSRGPVDDESCQAALTGSSGVARASRPNPSWQAADSGADSNEVTMRGQKFGRLRGLNN